MFMSRRMMLVAVLALSTSCGGGGGGGDDGPPVAFRWFATVTAVQDGNGMPASVPGVLVGDTMVGVVEYDPAAFDDGVALADGFSYAPPAGTVMSYLFSSGGTFTKEVTAASARDGGAFDQFNWLGGDFGGLLLQVNDPSDASFTLPLPAQFPPLHDDFVLDLAAFQLTGNERVEFPAPDPADARVVLLAASGFQVVAN